MKVRKISKAMAVALGGSYLLGLAPAANATGFIFVDPAFHVAPPVHVTPINPVTPITRPGTTPRPGTTTLHGTVTTGIHLEDQEISVEIQDHVAKTYIKQTFKNDTNRNLAGTYLFPLPQDATFSSFTLHIDGKPVEGKILAAAEARAQYEQIVRSMVDPGLLEYVDYKTVRARIFPIPANGSKTVELEYTQLLKSDGGMFKYRYPLKSANASASNKTEISMKLKGKSGLRTIWSPSHIIHSERQGANQAKVTFTEDGNGENKDFQLYYTVSDKELAANLLTHKTLNDKGFFLLALNPPLKAKQVMAKDIVLVADTSGSMRGEKMEQLKKALKYVVQSLNQEDKFSLVNFNTDAEPFTSELLTATPENRKKAEAFIDELEARGGTNIGDALSIGSNLLNKESAVKRPAYLILMTDGEPTVGKTGLDELMATVDSKRDIRLFDFGVGYDVNTRLMSRLAEKHHGTAQFLEPEENLETALSAFYSKIKNPILSDVKIAYEGIEVKDVYPRSVKDMFAGNQVMLLGRYKEGSKAVVKLTGKVDGVQRAYSFPLTFAANESTNAYLPRLWAMRRISYLTEVAQDNGDTKEVVDEIVALSKRYGIISAYTSFLSTDPNENNRLRPTPVPMPMTSASIRTRAGVRSGFAPGVAGFRQMSAEARPAAAPRLVFNSAQRKVLGASFAVDAAYAGGGGSGDKGLVAGRLAARRVMAESEAADEKKKEVASFKQAIAQSTGKRAIAFQKALRDLRKDVVTDGDGREVKVIGDKTFYMVNGFWVDASFENVKKPNLTSIEFGSKQYFDLVYKNSEIGKYMGAGQQVIFVYKGQCYKIVQPAVKTS
ncbi:MAG TPA: VIT and VWA domain-containing protein [Candidatus Melainabacteria bacterium]|nr:VIT and VWA domain-containing protein [Candidatus Melainabacteria bacterium]